MLCSEARELIRSGRCNLLTGPFSAEDADVDELDAHIWNCRSCRCEVTQEQWRCFRRRPGPSGLMRAVQLARLMANEPERSQADRPISRIVWTLIQKARTEGADALLIAQEMRPPPHRVEASLNSYDWQTESLTGRLALIEQFPFQEREGRPYPVSVVQCRQAGDWRELIAIPAYVHPAVVGRLKSMTRLKVSDTKHQQHGSLDLEVDGHKVSGHISSYPEQLGERILIEFNRPQ
jgi:hypothetical protein